MPYYFHFQYIFVCFLFVSFVFLVCCSRLLFSILFSFFFAFWFVFCHQRQLPVLQGLRDESQTVGSPPALPSSAKSSNRAHHPTPAEGTLLLLSNLSRYMSCHTRRKGWRLFDERHVARLAYIVSSRVFCTVAPLIVDHRRILVTYAV